MAKKSGGSALDFGAIEKKVKGAHADAVVSSDAESSAILVKADAWSEVANTLATDKELKFDSLMCLSGYDNGVDSSLGVAYNLYSMTHRHKIEIRIEVPRDGGQIPSVANLWRTADWHEREAYDMYGMTFTGHPDHRRMLLPDDWVGYPLKKDYQTPELYLGMPVIKDKRGWE